MLKITYEQTAKAEALSRLVGALLREAEEIARTNAGASKVLDLRYNSIIAEITLLEEINAEWRDRYEKEIARQQAAEIPEDQGWHGYPPALAKFLREATEAEKREARGEFRLVTQALQKEQAHQEAAGTGPESGATRPPVERQDNAGKSGQEAQGNPL